MGAVRMILLVGAVGAVAYWLFTRLALNGTLGLATQLRTEEQVLRAGSVLLGGRPEMAATAGLFLHRPEGFGSGTVLNPMGITAAQEAMSRLNYDPDNGDVYNYMFVTPLQAATLLFTLWTMFFGPLYTVAPILTLCLGVILVPQGAPRFLGVRRRDLPAPADVVDGRP